jgi:hypothetical protein
MIDWRGALSNEPRQWKALRALFRLTEQVGNVRDYPAYRHCRHKGSSTLDAELLK